MLPLCAKWHGAEELERRREDLLADLAGQIGTYQPGAVFVHLGQWRQAADAFAQANGLQPDVAYPWTQPRARAS
jgi:hypothetical protein